MAAALAHAAVDGAQRQDVARPDERSGVDAGSASTFSVCARSAALMPVEMRSAASTLTVYAVPRASSLTSTIGGRSSRSAIGAASARR